MKYVCLCVLFLGFGSSALADSDILGRWVENGKILSIGIVDRSGSGPFTAAEIWKSIKADRTNERDIRVVKTENFQLKCGSRIDETNTILGNCRIEIASKVVSDAVNTWNFVISHEEAKLALDGFVGEADNVLIRSRDVLLFEENWRDQMVSGMIHKSLVSD